MIMLLIVCSRLFPCQVSCSARWRAIIESKNIPEQYFVVTNNELVRVKYILVFAQERRVLAK